MKKLFSGLMAAAMSLSMVAASAVPMNAAPVVQPSVPQANDAIKVQERIWIPRGQRRGGNPEHGLGVPNQREFRGEWRRGDRQWRGNNSWRNDARWRDRGNYRYWNGHRGSREWRKGYRRHNNGWWFPLAAFTAGAVIGNTLNQPRVIYRDGGSAHTQWCYNRYRSYRASDNTFQPYNGPRKQCYSPYS